MPFWPGCTSYQNWNFTKSVHALFPVQPAPPAVSLQRNTHTYLAEIKVERKIHPHENLTSLDFSELFVLREDC